MIAKISRINNSDFYLESLKETTIEALTEHVASVLDEYGKNSVHFEFALRTFAIAYAEWCGMKWPDENPCYDVPPKSWDDL